MEEPVTFNFLDHTKVSGMSVHFGCTLRAKDRECSLFWSRFGMQDLIGPQCQLFSVLGMNAAVNIQTPLDGRKAELKPDIYKICREKATFVQLYTPSPHVQYWPRYFHPISGLITLCNLQHPQTIGAMQREAQRYLDMVKDMEVKLVGAQDARFEYVAYFPSIATIHSFEASAFIDEGRLVDLLESRPALLPFSRRTVIWMVRHTLEMIHEQLTSLTLTNAGKGGFEPAWRAYQLELAFEELSHGHPFLRSDRFYSASLGTCTNSTRSISHARGFLGLAPFNSAAAGDDPPPLNVWTTSHQLKSRVERLFNLSDLGAQMLMLILGDLYKASSFVPLSTLQDENPPEGYRLFGGCTNDELCHKLATVYVFSFPHVFARAKHIVSQAGKDVKACLLLGLKELNIKLFPLMRQTNKARNFCVQRVPNTMQCVYPVEGELPEQAVLSSLTDTIATIASLSGRLDPSKKIYI